MDQFLENCKLHKATQDEIKTIKCVEFLVYNVPKNKLLGFEVFTRKFNQTLKKEITPTL